jgi:prepilin-type processing-associated H-X9-DG protein
MSDVTTGIEPPTPPERKRRDWSWGRFLIWAVGIIASGIMVILVLSPLFYQASKNAYNVKCESNLRQIWQAIALYAQENGGQYPLSLAVLLAHKDITPSMLVCPASSDEAASAPDTAGVVAEVEAAENNAPGHKHCLSYVYVGRGLNSKTASKETVVVYEPLTNHDGKGANVLFGDGWVTFIDKHAWPRMAAIISAEINRTTTRP